MAYKIKSKQKRKKEYIVTLGETNKYHFKTKKEANKFLNPKEDTILWTFKRED
jgi:hypothetical protein